MELTIRPEDLRPGVTLVDVLALLNAGADAAAASAAQASPADLAEGSAPAPAPEPAQPDEDGHVPGAMVEGPQPPIEIPGQMALPLMRAWAQGASAAPAPSVVSPAPSSSAPSPATPSAPSPASSPALPERAELIGLARSALQGGRRDAVKTLLERAGVKRMSEIPDEKLTDATQELKGLLS